MKKLTYKGKDVKVVLGKDCEKCIFDRCCTERFDIVLNWEKKNGFKNCTGIKYLYT